MPTESAAATAVDAGERGSLLFTIRIAALLVVFLPALGIVLAFSRPGERTHRLVRAFTRRFMALSGCDVRVSGAEHLSVPRCAVLVANHSSYCDSVVLLAALPFDFRFVANHRAAMYPVIGRAIRKAGHLVVNRESLRSRGSCGRAMLETLQDGRSLLVYPEGTSRSGASLLPFRNGAFKAAVRTGCPVIPIAIRGTRTILPRSLRLLRRGAIDIAILPPIPADDMTRDAVARVRMEAQQAIAAALLFS